MTFGQIITGKETVVLMFYSDWSTNTQIKEDVGKMIPKNVELKAIDVDKNQELADALRIKVLPMLMIYKEGQMIVRQSGEITQEVINELLNKTK